MKYYSTNQQAQVATLDKAVVKGLAEDKGLYMPERIKPLPKEFFDEIQNLSFQDFHIQTVLRLCKKLIDVLSVVAQCSIPNLLSLFQREKFIRNISQCAVITDHFHSHTLHLTI